MRLNFFFSTSKPKSQPNINIHKIDVNAPHLYGKLVIENSSTEKETRSTRNEEEEETKCNQFDDYYVAHTQLHKRKWQIFVSSFDFLVIFLSALAFLAIFLFSNSIQNRLQLFLFSFIFVFFFHLNKKKKLFSFHFTIALTR